MAFGQERVDFYVSKQRDSTFSNQLCEAPQIQSSPSMKIQGTLFIYIFIQGNIMTSDGYA